jgi:hypothetical protein
VLEYVRSLPPEEKQAVFLALLREAIKGNGPRSLLPIDDENGKPFGYYVSADAARDRAAQLLGEMPPHVREELTGPVRRIPFEEGLTPDQLLAELSPGDRPQSP